jgi:hypothetical protein
MMGHQLTTAIDNMTKYSVSGKPLLDVSRLEEGPKITSCCAKQNVSCSNGSKFLSWCCECWKIFVNHGAGLNPSVLADYINQPSLKDFNIKIMTDVEYSIPSKAWIAPRLIVPGTGS